MKRSAIVILAATLVVGCSQQADKSKTQQEVEPVMGTIFEGEKHLTNVRQLTFGGQNAEAYFSSDGSELIFQSTRDSLGCDAIFRMNADGTNVRMVSTGNGTTTCSFIAPDDSSIIYSSTHLAGDDCPPKPDMSRGYVWPLYDSYEIFTAGPEGSNPVNISNSPGYDAEAVFSPKGDKIIFTSVRTGDLELFIMDADGGNVEQITDMPGYDGGAFFSLDGKSICWRASRPQGEALKEYSELLAEGLVRPSTLDIVVMNLQDRKPVQLTDNGKANFGPYFHPDGSHLVFSSNMDDPKGRIFNLYMVNVKTKEIEQITFNDTFDGFPMFTHDGSRLVWASNRDNSVRGETNIFIADWVW